MAGHPGAASAARCGSGYRGAVPDRTSTVLCGPSDCRVQLTPQAAAEYGKFAAMNARPRGASQRSQRSRTRRPLHPVCVSKPAPRCLSGLGRAIGRGNPLLRGNSGLRGRGRPQLPRSCGRPDGGTHAGDRGRASARYADGVRPASLLGSAVGTTVAPARNPGVRVPKPRTPQLRGSSGLSGAGRPLLRGNSGHSGPGTARSRRRAEPTGGCGPAASTRCAASRRGRTPLVERCCCRWSWW